MHVFLSNIHWMAFNIWLALLPVFFGWVMQTKTLKIVRICAFILWIIFLPNTLYLITDIAHFFRNSASVKGIFTILLFVQYLMLIIIGIYTYLLAMKPLPVLIKRLRIKLKNWEEYCIILIINGGVGVAIALGRFERTNSWYVFTNPFRVFHDSIQLFFSLESILLAFAFFCIGNLLYFTTLALKKNKRKR